MAGMSIEQVWEVPEGAEVLASSDKTGVEMFCVGEHVLGIQGHPEYTKDIFLSLVDRLLAAGSITVSACFHVTLQRLIPLTKRTSSRVALRISTLIPLCHSHTLQIPFAEAVNRQLETTAPDREFWLMLCKSFLKAREE
jgi:glucosinolate gamma-glutamyl hydrolase